MLNLAASLARLPLSPAASPLDVANHLSGARLFHAEAAGQALWAAELSRSKDGIALANPLFVSADGRNFHQLRIVERQEGAILADTPGFLPALAVYRDTKMTMIFGHRSVPSEGLSILLKRVPSKILTKASFFPAAAAPSAKTDPGPRVRAAEADREPDRKILQVQKKLAELDRGRERLEAYRTDRGLAASSTWAEAAPFGKIEAKVQARLGVSSVYRAAPLKILTIGPGVGRLESDLKDVFGEFVSIDSFALNDAVAPENWHAFDNLFIGNLDTHRLPVGYDLVFSIFGSSYAVDQRLALGRIVDSLNSGGEAFFLATGEMIPGHEPDVLGHDEAEFLRARGLVYETTAYPESALRSGLLVESVSLRKTDSRASSALLNQRWDLEKIAQPVWEAVRILAKSREMDVDPSASALDIARFRERLAFKRQRLIRQGHRTTIESAIFLWPWIVDQGLIKH
ncbi:MAG TPA: hypothetical protein VFX30_04520 [bacterium]|nr:hypothetical protein [bacterium]